jgi:magnesium-dependent phosphatase 1
MQLKQHDILIGAASRTLAPELAREMLSLLRIPVTSNQFPSATTSSNSSTTISSVPSPATSNGSAEAEVGKPAIDFFDQLQIFPDSKVTHFTRIHKDTGIPYEEMLFFDDEIRNKNVESLGVIMWLVRDGLTWRELEEGVKSWRKRNGRV